MTKTLASYTLIFIDVKIFIGQAPRNTLCVEIGWNFLEKHFQNEKQVVEFSSS